VVVDHAVRQFEITPDGTRVVFTAADALFLAPIEGGMPPTALAPARWWFALTPDGTRALYLGANDALHSVPLDSSGPPVRLDEPLPPGWIVFDLAVTGDGRRVVYRVGLGTPSSQIRSVPVDGSSAPILLGGPLVAGGDFRTLQLGGDGSRV